MSRTKIHRRSFLAATGASSLMIVSPRSVWSYAANEKLNTALIGAVGAATRTSASPPSRISWPWPIATRAAWPRGGSSTPRPRPTTTTANCLTPTRI